MKQKSVMSVRHTFLSMILDISVNEITLNKFGEWSLQS